MTFTPRPVDDFQSSALTARSAGPLTGIRVVDFTANMSGPIATMILGDQGADVIKVESLSGDVIRSIGTARAGMSAYFANLNRSKRCVAIDLTRPESRAVIEALLDHADVVVTNFRPGVSTKLELDPARVTASRPSLIYAEIVGFGSHGPYQNWPAYDQVIQALAGFAAIQADRATGRPSLVHHGVIDKATGQAAAQAISAALVAGCRTGLGRVLKISMLDVAISFLWPDGLMNHTILEPDLELPSIVNTFRLTDTKDGQIAFIVVTQPQWVRLLEAVGLPYDTRLDTTVGRMRHGGGYVRKVVQRLGELTTEEAVARLSEATVPVAPVLPLDELFQHPQIIANGTIAQLDHPVLGRIRQANPAVRYGEDDATQLRPAPRLGEHTGEVLAELGFTSVEVGQLRDGGVIIGS